MDSVREKLRSRLKDRGISYAAASRFVKKNPTYVQQFIKNENPAKLPEDVRAALSELTGLSEPDLGAATNLRNFKTLENIEDGVKVPIIDFASAGPGLVPADPYPKGVGQDYVMVQGVVSKSAFAVIIIGDSMEPEFYEGEIIVVDPLAAPRAGEPVLARIGRENETTFKLYYPRGAGEDGCDVFELVPINPTYDTITIRGSNPGEVVGPMVEHRRKRRSFNR